MCLINITWELGPANPKAVTSLPKSGYNEWEGNETQINDFVMC